MSRFRNLRADVGRLRQFTGHPLESREVDLSQMLRALLSPRLIPVALYRLAYWCGRHRLRPVGKLLSMANMTLFGLEIGLDCEIGPGLFLPHTSGTVIGASRIGANAVIYHNVTVGAKVPDMSYEAGLRPEIGDGVFLGAGCKVLGGIILGDNVTVGANAVVLKSVPSGCLVGGIPAVVIKRADA